MANLATSLRITLLTTVVVFTAYAPASAGESLDPQTAKPIFEQARDLSDRDAGQLWGLRMYGPMLLVDGDTRRVVANEADQEGHLLLEQGVYVGILPEEVLVANTATTWSGKRWTMLMWPLPDDPFDRRALLAHELWHRIQDQLGLPMSGSATTHLGTRDGRVWLQLEWRALTAALRAAGSERDIAIVDALAFRAHRRSLFADAANTERDLEMNEGLAEYTGFALSGRAATENLEAAARQLEDAEDATTFVRSFAYASGPAYGLLLDAFDPPWRRSIAPGDDLDKLLGRYVDLPGGLAELAPKAATRYDGDALMAREDRREADRQTVLADYRRRFVDGPLLNLDFVHMQVQFDPGNVDALDDLGSVYPSMRLTDDWGVLTVTGGALITKDWQRAIVPAPRDPKARPIMGEGYQLELADDWTLVPLANHRGFRLAHSHDQAKP